MAFSNIGDFTLAAGQSVFNGITFPDGNGDHGAQFISGHPTPPFRNVTSSEELHEVVARLIK
jgi:hypothetical protein